MPNFGLIVLMLILMRADLFCNLGAKIVRGYAKLPHSHDKKIKLPTNFCYFKSRNWQITLCQ